VTASSACIGPKASTALGLVLLGGMLLLRPIAVRAAGAEPTVEQLQNEIQQQNVLIHQLLDRVNELERHRAGKSAPVPRGPAVARRGGTAPPAAPSAASAAASEQAAAAPPGAPVAPATQQASSSAPGTFKVDAEAAQRALERTLTAAGALLIPYGLAEITPSFGYTRREIPDLVLFTENRNEYAASLGLQVGLPYETQISLQVPYIGVAQQTVDDFVAPAQQVASASGWSFGDVTMGLSKTLLHQHGWIPDLIAGIAYEAPTGPQTTNHVALPGSGQSRLYFSLTALKRQDPIAFVASLQYSKAFEHDNLNPGNQLTVVGGAYVATSPETSISALLQQTFGQAPTLNGVTLTGANTVQSVLVLGASSILGRGTLLNLQVGIGLTRDAPKYTVLLSLPIRFSWR
jgi:hypothetical protein